MITSNFALSEIKGDLFNSDQSLVHCVSRDFHMGKGIAVEFKSRFGNVDKLIQQNKNVGEVVYLPVNDIKVFYLVTKEKYYGKPTMTSMKQCLRELANLCIELDIKKVAMPRIGCGLDKLKWDSVKKIIETELLPFVAVDVYVI